MLMLSTFARNAASAAMLLMPVDEAMAQNVPVSPALERPMAQMPAAAPSNSPCVRGANRLTIAGVDLDLIKCQHIILLQDMAGERARAAEAQSKLLAEKMLLEGDVAAEVEKSRALAEWWAAYAKGAGIESAEHGK